jgi:hypothetical protein
MENTNPRWWTKDNSSAWDHVKEAMHRDWEQTKADFSKNAGHELNQQVGNTVKQAVGKDPVPPGNVPNPKGADWNHVEPALRYGYGARSEYGQQHPAWDQALEGKLHADWDGLKSDQDWTQSKEYIKKGWEASNKKS